MPRLPLLLCALTLATANWAAADPESTPQIIEAARQRAARLGEIVMGQDITRQVSVYQRSGKTNTYTLQSTQREGVDTMQRDGNTQKKPLQDKPVEPTEGEYHRISLSYHDGKIYLKEDLASTMRGLSQNLLPFEGVYEASVIEGSWEGYLKGQKLVLRICKDCRDRYARDIQEYLQSPQRLSAIEQEFRKQYLAMHDKILAEKGEGDSPEAQRIRAQYPVIQYLLTNAAIGIATTHTGLEAVTYTFEGDTLTARIDKFSTETRFRLSLPNSPPASNP